MLFSINNEELLKNYFNLSDDFEIKTTKKDILNPKEGLILGNMYYDSYIPYKNYKPSELTFENSQEKELLKIMELSFAVHDLQLKLDLNPNDSETYYLFKTYLNELNNCIKKYSEEYDVIDLSDDLKAKYTWYKNPWPWEVRK